MFWIMLHDHFIDERNPFFTYGFFPFLLVDARELRKPFFPDRLPMFFT
jgi:hypothetical protein